MYYSCQMYCPTHSIDLIDMIEVSVAVFEYNGLFLMQRRPSGKPYAGYWEFPGGKIEPDEDQLHALSRECFEELNVTVEKAEKVMTVDHNYDGKCYRLHIFKVVKWHGEFESQESQLIGWFKLEEPPIKLLDANHKIISTLLEVTT